MSFAVHHLLSPFSRRDNLYNLCTRGSSPSRLDTKDFFNVTQCFELVVEIAVIWDVMLLKVYEYLHFRGSCYLHNRHKPWRLRHQDCLKHLYTFTNLQGVAFHKPAIFATTAMSEPPLWVTSSSSNPEVSHCYESHDCSVFIFFPNFMLILSS